MTVANIQDQFTFTPKLPVRATVDELLKQPGEGEKTSLGMVIKSRACDLGGDFSVMEGVIQPRELIAPHLHRFEDQMLYVISGELEFELGGQDGLRFTAIAGSYVRKPRGILHTYRSYALYKSTVICSNGFTTLQHCFKSDLLGLARKRYLWSSHAE